MNTLKTKAKGVQFSYDKGPDGSIRVRFGRNQQVAVAAANLRCLCRNSGGERWHWERHGTILRPAALSTGSSRTSPR